MRLTYPLYAFLLSITLLFGSDIAWSSELAKQLTECAKEPIAENRLTCYDALAEKQQLADKPVFIQPNSDFLNSRLVVTPWIIDFNLTINEFAGLISNAIMDDGERVTVQGWTKEGNHYVLHITMRSPVQLRFLPSDTTQQQIPMSLLIDPVIDGQTVDPELYVITIASMVPDDDEAEDQ